MLNPKLRSVYNLCNHYCAYCAYMYAWLNISMTYLKTPTRSTGIGEIQRSSLDWELHTRRVLSEGM